MLWRTAHAVILASSAAGLVQLPELEAEDAPNYAGGRPLRYVADPDARAPRGQRSAAAPRGGRS